jgi:N-acetylneuraminate synthase
VNVGSDRTLSVLHNYIHKVRGILNYAGYQYLPLDTPLEISHHYGIEKLDQFGCCLVNIVNRSYCKKLIVVVDGQCHPEQKHEIKEEYFLVISGTLELILDKCTHILKPGDSILVPQNSTHSFRGLEDTVFEEISTTSVPSDSYYLDKRIQSAPRDQRKTLTTLHF